MRLPSVCSCARSVGVYKSHKWHVITDAWRCCITGQSRRLLPACYPHLHRLACLQHVTAKPACRCFTCIGSPTSYCPGACQSFACQSWYGACHLQIITHNCLATRTGCAGWYWMVVSSIEASDWLEQRTAVITTPALKSAEEVCCDEHQHFTLHRCS
jgi:hypothetical protein